VADLQTNGWGLDRNAVYAALEVMENHLKDPRNISQPGSSRRDIAAHGYTHVPTPAL